MIKPLKRIAEDDLLQVTEKSWIHNFNSDFKRRFLSLMSFDFRTFDLTLCIGILDPNLTTNAENDEKHDPIKVRINFLYLLRFIYNLKLKQN